MMKSGVKSETRSVVSAARILVIEDNGSDVFLLDRALQRQNLRFELVHLSSGGEALASSADKGPMRMRQFQNLILLDLNLSKYTGEDILREIRKRHSPRRRSGVRMEFFPLPAR